MPQAILPECLADAVTGKFGESIIQNMIPHGGITLKGTSLLGLGQFTESLLIPWYLPNKGCS